MQDERTTPPPTVDVHYLKSNGFREVSCDGALGGPTPQGKLWIAFYSERFPLPRVARHHITPTEDGTGYRLSDVAPEPIEGREGIIRNVEFGMYLDLDGAEALRSWLTRQIDELKAGGEQ